MGMRLVIDPEHVQSCVMVLGKVELPLTREQVVQMYFGDEYVLVRRDIASVRRMLAEVFGDEYELVQRGVAKAVKRASAPKPDDDATGAVILKRLARGPASLPEIRDAIDPRVLASHPRPYLAGAIGRLCKLGKAKRTGTRGAFVYELAGAKASSSCSKCTKPAVAGKKLCREHLAIIRANQKKSVQLKLNGAHMNGAAEVTA